MTRYDLQINEEEFRSNAPLREGLLAIMGNPSFIMALQVMKNAALSPKLPPNATLETRGNVSLLMQGVTTVISDLDRLCKPLDREGEPNPKTHYRDPVLQEWFTLDSLPPDLREPIVPQEYLPQPRKTKAKK